MEHNAEKDARCPRCRSSHATSCCHPSRHALCDECVRERRVQVPRCTAFPLDGVCFASDPCLLHGCDSIPSLDGAGCYCDPTRVFPPAEHTLVGYDGRWACTCGWTPALGESVHRAFDRHILSVLPPGQTAEKGPRRRDYWPDSSRPNWCPCVEGDPHLCKPELHPTSPVHGAGTRPIPPGVSDSE